MTLFPVFWMWLTWGAVWIDGGEGVPQLEENFATSGTYDWKSITIPAKKF